MGRGFSQAPRETALKLGSHCFSPGSSTGTQGTGGRSSARAQHVRGPSRPHGGRAQDGGRRQRQATCGAWALVPDARTHVASSDAPAAESPLNSLRSPENRNSGRKERFPLRHVNRGSFLLPTPTPLTCQALPQIHFSPGKQAPARNLRCHKGPRLPRSLRKRPTLPPPQRRLLGPPEPRHRQGPGPRPLGPGIGPKNP